MPNGKLIKITACLLVASAFISLTGCGKKENASSSGKIQITVSQWPNKEADPTKYESKMKIKENFEKKYPNIEIVPDEWTFELQTFNAKAEGGTLPTIYQPFLTEAKRINENRYAYDVTDLLKEYGYYDKITDFFMDTISKDGRIFHIPGGIYSVGLAMNYDILKEAGLVNEDESPMIPQTFDELREFAKTIKAKTGKAGFVFPTTKNIGGWIFNVLAWNYGTEFMKQASDGSWEATFNTPETASALQFLYDMKWVDDTLPANTLVDADKCTSYIGTSQAAMSLLNIYQFDSLPRTYDISKDSLVFAKVPAGPKGHYTLMGGGTYAISPKATPEQADAAIKWLEFTNIFPTLTSDEAIEQKRISYQETFDAGKEIMGLHDLSAWASDYYFDKNGHYLIDEYLNVDASHLASYNDPTGIDYHVEEPVCTQELYSILDKCLQEVLTNKNVNIEELVANAEDEFQNNYLNYAN